VILHGTFACSALDSPSREIESTATSEVRAFNDVRTLAHHLGVDVKRVTDEAHFADDRGLIGSTVLNE
jgi:hypothetical protein